MKFRAAVLSEVNGPLTIETLEMAPLEPTDVLVRRPRPAACVIRSGSHTRARLPIPCRSFWATRAPEWGGVGQRVTQVKPGDHVICSWNPHVRSLLLLRADPAYPVRAVCAQFQPRRFFCSMEVAHCPVPALTV